MSDYKDMQTIVNSYNCALLNLQSSSKQMITKLTILAENYVGQAATIVRLIEERLTKVRYDLQLPILYLIDSITKNVKVPYAELFSHKIIKIFGYVLGNSRHENRIASLKKMRNTWDNVYPETILKYLDLQISNAGVDKQDTIVWDISEIDQKIIEKQNEILQLEQQLSEIENRRQRNKVIKHVKRKLSDSFSELSDENEKRNKVDESMETM